MLLGWLLISRYKLFRILENVERALVIGIGGGGDIFTTIPTRNFLKNLGIKVYVGSALWERFVVDPYPGPRPLEQLTNIERLTTTTCLAGGRTVTVDGVKLQASYLSERIGEEVLLIDITKGVDAIVEGLSSTCSILDIDLVVGIDGGGDVLARGREPNLRSPLCDSIMLASLRKLRKKNFIGVFASSCDGELSLEEVLNYLSDIAMKGGLLGAYGMSREDVEELEKLVENMPTEVSKLALMGAKGYRGEVGIREGIWKVNLSVISTLTFYLDTVITYDLSPLAQAVSSTHNIYEANERLHEIGVKTELDIELEAHRRGARSYLELFKNKSSTQHNNVL